MALKPMQNIYFDERPGVIFTFADNDFMSFSENVCVSHILTIGIKHDELTDYHAIHKMVNM